MYYQLMHCILKFEYSAPNNEWRIENPVQQLLLPDKSVILSAEFGNINAGGEHNMLVDVNFLSPYPNTNDANLNKERILLFLSPGMKLKDPQDPSQFRHIGGIKGVLYVPAKSDAGDPMLLKPQQRVEVVNLAVFEKLS